MIQSVDTEKEWSEWLTITWGRRDGRAVCHIRRVCRGEIGVMCPSVCPVAVSCVTVVMIEIIHERVCSQRSRSAIWFTHSIWCGCRTSVPSSWWCPIWGGPATRVTIEAWCWITTIGWRWRVGVVWGATHRCHTFHEGGLAHWAHVVPKHGLMQGFESLQGRRWR